MMIVQQIKICPTFRAQIGLRDLQYIKISPTFRASIRGHGLHQPDYNTDPLPSFERNPRSTTGGDGDLAMGAESSTLSLTNHFPQIQHLEFGRDDRPTGSSQNRLRLNNTPSTPALYPASPPSSDRSGVISSPVYMPRAYPIVDSSSDLSLSYWDGVQG